MEIREDRIDGVTVLELCGRMVVPEEIKLRAAVRSALDSGAREIVVDLSGVLAIDSSGIGELVAMSSAAGARGAEVRVSLPHKLLRCASREATS